MSRRYQRINFLLEDDLYEKFTLAAKKKTLSKSRLIQTWINTDLTKISYINRNMRKKSKTFNFRILTREYNLIRDRAEHSNLTISEFLRQIIYNNLRIKTRNHEDEKNVILEYFHQGKLSDILKYCSNNFLTLTNEESLIYIRTLVEVGEFKKCIEIAKFFQMRFYNNQEFKNEIQLAVAESYRYLINFDQTEIILSNISRREILSRAYYQSLLIEGDIFLLKENVYSAIEKYSTALDYFSMTRSYFEQGKLLLKLSNAYSYLLDFKLSFDYLAKCNAILDVYDNRYLKAMFYDTLGIINIALGTFTDKANIKKSINLNDFSGSKKELFYNHRNLASIELGDGNYKQAFELFNQATKYEHILRPELKFSRTDLFKSFINSSHDFKGSYNKMLYEYRNLKHSVNKNLHEYVLACMCYINGDTIKQRRDGEIRLNLITQEASYPLLKEVAKKTLLTKNIFPLSFK